MNSGLLVGRLLIVLGLVGGFISFWYTINFTWNPEFQSVNRKHPGETAGVFELILGGAPLGSQLDCRRVSTDGGGLCGLISLLGRRPVPGE